MRTVRLVYMTDNESMVQGLIPAKLKHNRQVDVCTTGALLTHDLLEHINGFGEMGTIEDEIEALGALFFVRGQDFRIEDKGNSMHSSEHIIARDIQNILTQDIEKPVRCIRESNWDVCIAEIIRELDKVIDSDIKTPELYKSIATYLTRGYNKAKRKYENVYSMSNAFWNLANRIDRYLQFCSYEGQEFILKYDLANNTSSFTDADTGEEY